MREMNIGADWFVKSLIFSKRLLCSSRCLLSSEPSPESYESVRYWVWHSYAISDGKTNWLEGLVLMVVYVIIGLSVWYYVSSFRAYL